MKVIQTLLLLAGLLFLSHACPAVVPIAPISLANDALFLTVTSERDFELAE